jgi:hypothetical protein
MDIGAYIQIEDLSKVARANGIEVPRLRGYRLMVNERAVSSNEIAKMLAYQELNICERACYSEPRFRPDSNCSEYSSATARLRKKYCIYETRKDKDSEGCEHSYKEVVGFRWHLIHGKNRKAIKFAIKKGRKAVIKQLQTFNKYVGREDVLYIHARIGGGNWGYFGGPDVARQPWFLEKVDDYFDDTYCDIYAKIDPASVQVLLKQEETEE